MADADHERYVIKHDIALYFFGSEVVQIGHYQEQGREGQAAYTDDRFVFKVFFPGIHNTFLDAKSGINVQAEQHPDEKSDPGVKGQEDHHPEADQDTECRDKGHERNPEPAGGIFHFIAHDQYAGADQDKGKQGSDAGHFAHHATGDKSGEHTDEQHKQQVGFIGGAVGFVHI